MITEVVRLSSSAGSADAFLAAHSEHAPAYFSEPGCLTSRLLQSTEDESDFMYIIEWENRDAEESAAASPAGKRF